MSCEHCEKNMTPHGRNTVTRAHFRITGVDEAAGTVELHLNKDGWDETASNIVQIPWAEFIRDMMHGVYEIHLEK
jgi:hypothetical protein